MKTAKVQYIVKESYAETNKANIMNVMAELRELGHPGINYSAFVLDDGKSFVHFAMFADEEANAVLSNLASFQSFRKQLKESQPESPPNAEDLTLVGSSHDIF